MEEIKVLESEIKLQSKPEISENEETNNFNTQKKVRLDAYLANKKPEISRTLIKKKIEEGEILVNGKKTKTSYIVRNKRHYNSRRNKAKGNRSCSARNSTRNCI